MYLLAFLHICRNPLPVLKLSCLHCWVVNILHISWTPDSYIQQPFDMSMYVLNKCLKLNMSQLLISPSNFLFLQFHQVASAFLSPSFLLQNTPSPSRNSVVTLFRILPDSDHFCSFHPQLIPPSWPGSPSSTLTDISASAFGLLQLNSQTAVGKSLLKMNLRSLIIIFSVQRYDFFLNHANILTKLLILQQNKQKKHGCSP